MNIEQNVDRHFKGVQTFVSTLESQAMVEYGNEKTYPE